MTVRYMEGFETVRQYTDLQVRGAAASSVVSSTGGKNNQSVAPARYAGGQALVAGARMGSTRQLVQRLVGPVGDGGGLAVSFAARAVDFNNNSTRNVIRYVNGNYAAPNVASAISNTLDYKVWPSVHNIAPAGIATTDIIYDVTRDEYVVHAMNNSLPNDSVFLTSSDINSTAWTRFNLGSGLGPAGAGRLFQTADGVLFCITARRILARPTGNQNWQQVYAAPSNSIGTGAVFDGTKWIVSYTQQNTLTSVDGINWVLSGTVANANGDNIAYGNGIIVMGKPTIDVISVSTDGGLTFTIPTLPNKQSSAGGNVAFGNGVFVVMSRNLGDNQVYVSADGVTWNTYIFDKSVHIADVTFQNGVFFATSSSGSAYVAYSTDGINWYWNESGIYVTGATANHTGLVNIPFNIQASFSITPNGEVFYRYNTGREQAAASSLGVRPWNQWSTYEAVITKNSSTSYTVDFIVDNVPVDSKSFSWLLMSATGPAGVSGLPNGSTGYGAFNGTTAVVWDGVSSSAQFSIDGGVNWSPVSLPGTSNVSKILWTGTKFIIFGTLIWWESPDGQNWSVMQNSAAGIAVMDAEASGSTILVISNAPGTYHRSSDNGATWTTFSTLNTSYRYDAIAYVNGTWIAQPQGSSTILRDYMWSTDDGLTWTPLQQSGSRNVGHAQDAGTTALFTSSQGGVWRVTVPEFGSPPVLEQAPSSVNNAIVGLAYNGKYWVASYAGGVYYSTDAASWTLTGTRSTGVYVTTCGTTFLKSSNGLNIYELLYPEFSDIPLSFESSGYSFTSIDDVVVTDFLPPNAGPQGEVRILLMPSDTDVQAQWQKIPEDSPTNASAGARVPGSMNQGTYVEASEVGMKDAYGTSSFSYPTGLRPLAMQVEAQYERVFTNVPKVKLGLQGESGESQTPDIEIKTPLGQSTYVSKVLDTNPDTGTSWKRETINGTKLTTEKTG